MRALFLRRPAYPMRWLSTTRCCTSHPTKNTRALPLRRPPCPMNWPMLIRCYPSYQAKNTRVLPLRRPPYPIRWPVITRCYTPHHPQHEAVNENWIIAYSFHTYRQKQRSSKRKKGDNKPSLIALSLPAGSFQSPDFLARRLKQLEKKGKNLIAHLL